MDWKNPEEVKVYHHKWYEAKKEEIREQHRQYYEAHKEERREQHRQYYEANKEKIAERKRRYRQQYNGTPRGRAVNMANNLKRMDEKTGRGECTITPEWIEENIFTSKCIYCGEDDWRLLGCDRIDNSLPHTPDNVVCSCWSCNNKRNTMPFDKFVTKCKAGEIVTHRNDPKKSKPVFACNSETLEIVYEFPSIMEAGRNGFKPSVVAACCKGHYMRDGNHRYKGLDWFYK